MSKKKRKGKKQGKGQPYKKQTGSGKKPPTNEANGNNNGGIFYKKLTNKRRMLVKVIVAALLFFFAFNQTVNSNIKLFLALDKHPNIPWRFFRNGSCSNCNSVDPNSINYRSVIQSVPVRAKPEGAMLWRSHKGAEITGIKVKISTINSWYHKCNDAGFYKTFRKEFSIHIVKIHSNAYKTINININAIYHRPYVRCGYYFQR